VSPYHPKVAGQTHCLRILERASTTVEVPQLCSRVESLGRTYGTVPCRGAADLVVCHGTGMFRDYIALTSGNGSPLSITRSRSRPTLASTANDLSVASATAVDRCACAARRAKPLALSMITRSVGGDSGNGITVDNVGDHGCITWMPGGAGVTWRVPARLVTVRRQQGRDCRKIRLDGSVNYSV
jgi:hypothetical protein